MPQYLYQLSYTADSLAAQIQNPQDRLETAARPVLDAIGGKLLGGGFSFGKYDVTILIEAPDDESAAAVSVAVAAGGAVSSSKTDVPHVAVPHPMLDLQPSVVPGAGAS